ncbi:MAG TPA: hypothetical protein VM008_09720 [Phycisphaerae bacterium]|nr:hypothetical protein [Phycisphaerae bacterium]
MTMIDNTLSEPMETQAAPPSIWQKLRGITAGKKKTANHKHFSYVKRIAAGDSLNDRQIAEFHESTLTAGYSDSDAEHHANVFRRLADAESAAATQPAVRRAMEVARDHVTALDAQLAELAAKRAEAETFFRQKLLELSNVNNAAASVESLRNQVDALTND